MHQPHPVPPARILCRAACSLALGLAVLAPSSLASSAVQDPTPSVEVPRDLRGATLDELEQHALDVGEALRRALLEPDPKVVREQRKLLVHPHTGVTRLLNGEGVSLPGPRGGGCYFSFATGLHSYDHQPDLSLRGGRFDSGFYGGQDGAILHLGEVDLLDLPSDPMPLPTWLPETDAAAWATLWRDLDDDAEDPEGRPDALRDLRLRPGAPRLGHSYLLRMHSAQEHDHLVAFQVVQQDEFGCTITWHRLEDWPLADVREPRPAPEVDTGELPRSLQRLDVPELLERLAAIRRLASPLLYAVPEDLREAHARALGEAPAGATPPSTGRDARGEADARTSVASDAPAPVGELRYARVLARGRYDHLVTERGGGAYLSLLTHSHDYDDLPDLEYINGDLLSGFAGGDEGLFLDLGVLSGPQQRALFDGRTPEGMGGPARDALETLRKVRCAPREDPRDSLQVDPRTLKELRRLGARDRLPVQVGHSYALRTLLVDSHDVLGVFTVLAADADGLTLAYRVLETVRPPEEGLRAGNGLDGGPAPSSGAPERTGSGGRR